MSSASISTSSRKRRREVQWEEVVEELRGITIDKQGLVRDLIKVCPDTGDFVYQHTRHMQELMCKECGIEGWTDTLVDTIKSMVR